MAKAKPSLEKPEAQKNVNLTIAVGPKFLKMLKLYCLENDRKPGELVESIVSPRVEGTYVVQRGKKDISPEAP